MSIPPSQPSRDFIDGGDLPGRLGDEIRRRGPISFEHFMALALYAPGGYYARAPRIGRGGDFFTSVSVGPLFGRLLAGRVARWWEESDSPARWRILEPGGHDGQLALDLLDQLAVAHPRAYATVEYTLVEPLDALAAAQRETLARHLEAGRVRQVDSPDSLPSLPGTLVANEVLDALPFQLVESTGTGWSELGVDAGPDGRLGWCRLGPVSEAAGAILPARPEGYRTEVRPDLAGFIAPFARCLSPGLMTWIDYGFERGDYYHESRSEGTFRTFRGHRAGDDLLEAPGDQDITAHVDFTALREAVAACGGRAAEPEPQARYLTRLAEPWLRSLEGRTDADTMALVRQFQTLTHPAQLGARFQVLEATLP